MKGIPRLLALLLPFPLAAAPSLALSLNIDLSGLLNPQITADAQANLIVAGMVSDCSRPVVNPIATCGGYWVAKMDPTGATLRFATYIGSPYQPGQNRGAVLQSVRADRDGNIVILSTASQNSLPVVNAIQSAVKGDSNLHLAKLAADGSGFLYATYLGRSGSDYAYSLALDDSGAAYANVFSRSFDFPGAPPFQYQQNLLLKFSPDGRLIYVSAYAASLAGGSLRVDASGSAQIGTPYEIFQFSPDGSSNRRIPLPPWVAGSNPLAFLTADGGFWAAGTVTDTVLPVTPNAVQASDLRVPYLRIEQGQATPAERPMTGYGVNGFAVDPVERFRIYAATTSGLFRSEDNGRTWDQIYPSAVQSAVVDPFDQNTLYIAAGTLVPNYMFLRSKDRGQTWTRFAAELTDIAGYYGLSISADPHTPGKLYIAGGPFYHSEDGGGHWSGGWNGSWGAPLPPQITDGSGQLSDKANVAIADPSAGGRVYVLSETSCIGFCPVIHTLARSDDGGATFTLLKNAFNPQIDPSTGDVFAPNLPAGQLTVFRSGNFDVPELLVSPGKIDSMAFDPQNPGALYVALDSGDVFSSADSGRTFQYLVTLPTAAASIAVGDGGVIQASQSAHSTDGFVFQYDSLGKVVYGTYLGGGQTHVKAAAIAPNGHLFIAGYTGPGLPIANAIQSVFGGAQDGFMAEFDPSGALVSSTYLGGPGKDEIDSIEVLADGSVLAAGSSAGNTMIWRIMP